MMLVVQVVFLMATVLGVQCAVVLPEGNQNTELDLHKYIVEEDCKDTHSDCAQWASEGECEKNELYMRERCRLSCGSCGCVDTYINSTATCEIWAEEGYCERDPTWMHNYCAKTCDSCGCEDRHPDCWDRAERGDCIKSTTKQWMKENCPIRCAACEGKCLDNVSKGNVYNNINCQIWARCGYCGEDYPKHKQIHDRCPKSCGLCTDDPIPTAPATCQDWLPKDFCIRAAKDGICKSPAEIRGCMETCGGCEWLDKKHENECGFLSCDQWKDEGYCENDPCFMDLFCEPVCEPEPRGCENSGSLPDSGPQPCTATGTC